MTTLATFDLDRWRDALATWGPAAYGAVVVLMIAVLLLNGRGGETALFAVSAAGVALILFGNGVDLVRDLFTQVTGL